ncbi:hypothetical protein LTR86_007363 [Recurvomyces mirabilis]|nr:hypothetical protein LTR86_007363 [Recurvomyces mirabilis]
MYAILASAALLATTAVAQSVGSATVVSKCNYDVFLANVPAQGGGFNEVDRTLKSGDSYTQQWTELSNGNGWSIKLSKDKTNWNSDIMQYEYTFHNDGIIWYDLSDVNGNPWSGDWEITANATSSPCTPKQQAYRYATDDAYGMQSCSQDADITVTLCSGESQNDGAAASASSSVAAASSTFVSVAQSSSQAASTALTTLATLVSTSSAVTTNNAGATVTQVATAVVTEVATVTHWRHHSKRHARAHATAA